MFLQSNPSDNYDSTQQLATQIAVLRGQLNMMRLDHPEREALLKEFTTLQGRLTLARTGLQGFGAPVFTY